MAFVNTNAPLPGIAFAFPDVCNTPMGPVVVPIPYPNIAMDIMAIPDQFTFLAECFPVHNIATIIPLTQGDDPGILMGEMSGTVMGPCEFMDGSPVLLAGGVPTTMLGASTMQNSTDAFGFEIAPTQTVLATV